MKAEAAYYKVYPKVVLSGTEVTVHIDPLYDHCRFSESREYEIVHLPMEYSGVPCAARRPSTVKALHGNLQYTGIFPGEQEHMLEIWETAEEGRKQLACFHVYSLERDLFERRPFKGDLHMHSCHSDGKESPAYVAAACRRIGLDFMAVTDHGKYLPSVEAQEAYRSIETGLKIFRGEEVHPPENAVHMINFGGSFSVNALFHQETYLQDIARLDQEAGETPPDVNRYQYLSCVWCFDKIREGGGLGIFCHPFWVYRNKYDVSSPLTFHLMEQMPFDALELLGGYPIREVDSNTLQVACYNDFRSRGKAIPIVGVSDAHGCETDELFGWYYTLVFSPGLELPEIIQSIKGLFSVAVEAIPGQTVRVYGPFRMVKYALFLINHVFPQHDAGCCLEGRLMQEYITGDRKAADQLRELTDRNKKAFELNWADKIG